jgi:hypothetical protein
MFKLHEPNLTKTCLCEIIKESQFLLAFQTSALLSLMIHSLHSSFSNVLQTLLMVGCLKVNDVTILPLANYPLTMVND